jgi:hypothetical protein
METAATLAPPTEVVTGFADSTPLLGDAAALRARAETDGFLFFRGFLPTEPLWELRRQILQIVQRYGWLRRDAELMDGVADLDAVAASDARDKTLYSIGVTAAAYRDIQRLELFHAIPHHPKLIALYEKLFQTEVLPHPRHIARVLLPAPSFAPTPPHQDYIYIHGTHRFWTCWFPLGDVPVDLGGLSLLRGSHREPVLDVVRGRGAGGLEAILCGKDYTWVQDDYRCGDIITFPSHAVHKGLPNQQGAKIRLSCDIRYQPANEEIEERSLQPHMGVATWDELYQGWQNDDLKYYWRKRQLKLCLPTPANIRERPC